MAGTVQNLVPDYSFIPRRLEIEEKPHLKAFPLNIAIAKRWLSKDGIVEASSVIYEPSIDSYQDLGNIQKLEYFSTSHSGYKIKIFFNPLEEFYFCKKYNKEELVGTAFGKDWKEFFTKVGLLDLSHGEVS